MCEKFKVEHIVAAIGEMKTKISLAFPKPVAIPLTKSQYEKMKKAALVDSEAGRVVKLFLKENKDSIVIIEMSVDI